RADRFGLADLYQLRGRVGRSTHRAYAYLLLPRELMGVGPARKRIEAIRQYTSLGAGFQIAMRDLEIRGAGNLLGLSQSGHITAVGFHLYCQMLETAVAALRGKPLPGRADVPVTLDFLETRPERVLAGQVLPAFLPVDYVADEKSRMEVFRRLSNAGSTGEVKAVRTLLRDRFGRIPEAAENLLSLHALRVLAAEKKIDSLTVKGDRLIIERGGEPLQIEGRFPRLQATQPKAKFAEIIAAVRTM
ncbi:MAG: transcription-repair coupling factor, partial [Verrucomicrobia bacterium]|nr:transcription-repair coupling factor [Verrucomicrobiota bacterium]